MLYGSCELSCHARVILPVSVQNGGARVLDGNVQSSNTIHAALAATPPAPYGTTIVIGCPRSFAAIVCCDPTATARHLPTELGAPHRASETPAA